eukprot:GFUD01011660.1.p1 GENE.GFUD01011660.1~~GFUD01011660.1.p1  ORF type:complete len:675 (+),score=113.89 GFUD01011660.1:76-2100(+)
MGDTIIDTVKKLSDGEDSKADQLEKPPMDVALVQKDRPANKCGKVGKHVKKKFPILEWLPKYNLDCAVSDMIAGVTVGLTVIPQSIAYAAVAGLSPQYGLYSSFMGCFAYCVFGSTKDITIGPTAIMALMTGAVFQGELAKYGEYYAVLLAFFSGIIIFIFGILQLGFLIDFISVPVIAGFTSAAAITIASGQIKGLLGIHVEHKSHSHAGVVDDYIDIFNNIDSIRYQDAILGITCAILLLLLRALNRTNWFKPLSGDESSAIQQLMNKLPEKALFAVNKTVWFICTSRNAVVVIFCLVLGAFLDPDIAVCQENRDNCTFTLTGTIDAGIPKAQLPPFSIPANASGTGEPEEDISFTGMVTQLGSNIIIIPIIAILESVAIAKAFSGGKPVDASQEMIALGVCNMLGSFVQSMPTTGSFSRTAVNSASGVKTPFGGIYTGGLVILCLAFLMPYCAFIPKATLSAVIMTAVIFSVEYEVLKPMWGSKKLDLLPGIVCLLVGLFYELDKGIFAGVGLHLLIVLYHVARPKVTVEVKQVDNSPQQYLLISPDQGIIFPSVSFIRSLISKAGVSQGNSELPVVIDCSHINQTDFTAAEGFKAMLADFKARSQAVYWLSPSTEVMHVIKFIAGDSFIAITNPADIVTRSNGSLDNTPENTSDPLLEEVVADNGAAVKV